MNIEKISSWLLKGLMAVIIIVFVLFFLVGYDTPYEENPNMVSPKLLDVVLVLCIALVIAAVIATVWSAVLKVTQGSNKEREEGLIGRTGLISGVAFIGSIVIGLIVGIVQKDQHLLINGKDWHEPVESIITDTSLVSIVILLVITLAALIYSMVTKVKK